MRQVGERIAHEEKGGEEGCQEPRSSSLKRTGASRANRSLVFTLLTLRTEMAVSDDLTNIKKSF